MPFVDLNKTPQVLMAGYSDGKGAFYNGEKIRFAMMTELEGEGARPHKHPDEQIIFILQGKMWFRVGGEEKICGPGEVAVIYPNVVHENRVVEGPLKFFTARSEPFVDLRGMAALSEEEGK